MVGQTYDKERISVNTARLKKDNLVFEIAVDADLAIALKNGKSIDVSDVLKSRQIFSDVKKGLVASEHEMQKIFNTTNTGEVAKKIILEGEIQLTAEYRQKLREEKRKKILEMIHRNGVDPKTKLPHPITRIENAFAEAKVTIDEYKTAEDQLQDILKKIRPVLPISLEKAQIAVKVPATYAAKSYSTVKKFSTILKDEWQNDGSWVCRVEIPAGMKEEFFDKLNSLTHGDVETKVIEK